MNLIIKTKLQRKAIKIFLNFLFLCFILLESNFDVKFDFFCQARRVDALHFGFIVFSFLVLHKNWRLNNFKDKNLIFLIYPFLPLLALIFFISIGPYASSLIYSKNIDAYRIIGGSFYMIITGLFIFSITYNHKKNIEIYRSIYSIICLLAVIFLVVYILIRFFNFQPLLYGEGTPALFFPFDSPNQAAVFLLTLLFLALGLCVFLKRTSDFIILCPIFSLAGFQTGSRTYGFLYFLFLLLLIVILFMRFIQRYKIYHRELFNILLALIFSSILVLVFNDKTSSRPFSLIGVSFSEIIFKSVDPFRMKTNLLWGSLNTLKFDISVNKINLSTFQCRSNSEEADISNVKKAYLDKPDLHNVFLEFFVFGGVYGLAGYLLFISSLIFFSFSLIIKNINSFRLSFLKITFFASLLSIFAFQSTNPIFTLRFTWVLYGLIIGFFLNSRNKLI